MAPTPQQQDYAYGQAGYVPTGAKSSMKGILSGDGQPASPVNHGRKSVPHRESNLAPFATYDKQTVDGDQARGGSKLLTKKKDVMGKVGAQEFDPEVYRQRRIDNNANLASQKAKNWGSGEVFSLSAAPQVDKQADQMAALSIQQGEDDGYAQGYAGSAAGGYAPSPAGGYAPSAVGGYAESPVASPYGAPPPYASSKAPPQSMAAAGSRKPARN